MTQFPPTIVTPLLPLIMRFLFVICRKNGCENAPCPMRGFDREQIRSFDIEIQSYSFSVCYDHAILFNQTLSNNIVCIHYCDEETPLTIVFVIICFLAYFTFDYIPHSSSIFSIHTSTLYRTNPTQFPYKSDSGTYVVFVYDSPNTRIAPGSN
eukprot:124103_1